MFRIETSSCWIFPVMTMKCPSSSLLIDFSLKSNLLDTRRATPALFLVHLIGISYPNPLLWDNVCLWIWGVFLVCIGRMDTSIHSVSLCLLIGELWRLILREINVHSVFILVCFWFVVGIGIVCEFTLPFILYFCRVGLSIAYVCASVVNFLRLEFSFQYFL